MNSDEVDHFVHDTYAIDMGDYWYVTFEDMEKLVNDCILIGKNMIKE